MNAVKEELLLQAEGLLAARHFEQAAACFDQAEQAGALADHCAGRRWFCYMLAGDYERAWQQSDAIRARSAPDPHRVWDGTPLRGKRVMVRSLHGFGDAIQMLRYAPLIRSQAARLTLQLAPQLVSLARTVAGIDEAVAWGDERPYDVQLEITELPYVFRSTLSTLPMDIPYLRLSADKRVEASALLGEKVKPRVGLVWSGSAWDSTRSLPLHLLECLLPVRDAVEFWCLQPDTSEWERFCLQHDLPFLCAGGHAANTFAACTAAMDLVITVDTFAAHLAGALGTPAWILLKRQADWRWLWEREDSPWYPSLRLFRQSVEGEWEPVVAHVARELSRIIDKAILGQAVDLRLAR